MQGLWRVRGSAPRITTSRRRIQPASSVASHTRDGCTGWCTAFSCIRPVDAGQGKDPHYRDRKEDPVAVPCQPCAGEEDVAPAGHGDGTHVRLASVRRSDELAGTSHGGHPRGKRVVAVLAAEHDDDDAIISRADLFADRVGRAAARGHVDDACATRAGDAGDTARSCDTAAGDHPGACTGADADASAGSDPGTEAGDEACSVHDTRAGDLAEHRHPGHARVRLAAWAVWSGGAGPGHRVLAARLPRVRDAAARLRSHRDTRHAGRPRRPRHARHLAVGMHHADDVPARLDRHADGSGHDARRHAPGLRGDPDAARLPARQQRNPDGSRDDARWHA